MRYILNISFYKNSLNIVEPFKTLKEAESYKSIIDDTVKQALIKDTVNGNIIWLKK